MSSQRTSSLSPRRAKIEHHRERSNNGEATAAASSSTRTSMKEESEKDSHEAVIDVYRRAGRGILIFLTQIARYIYTLSSSIMLLLLRQYLRSPPTSS